MQNIATGTLLLFLLVIPGMAFRQTYTYGPLSRKVAKHSAFDDFIIAIIPGICIQFLGASIVNHFKSSWVFCGYYVDFLSIGRLLTGNNASEEFGKIGNYTWQIFLYNSFLIGIAALAGYLLRLLIRKTAFDHKFRALRFSNDWWYLLRGEFFLFRENKARLEIPEGYPLPRRRRDLIHTCYVYALVKGIDGKCFIYRGIVDKFYLSQDGTLDTIQIYVATRMPFAQTQNNQNRSKKKKNNQQKAPFNIGGNAHVIKYSEVIDLNVEIIPKWQADTETISLANS